MKDGGTHLELNDVVGVDAALVDEAALGAGPELVLRRGGRSIRLLQACCSACVRRGKSRHGHGAYHDLGVPAGVADADAHVLAVELLGGGIMEE